VCSSDLLAHAAVNIRLATKVREPFVQMTKCMIEQFGGDAAFVADAQAWQVTTQPYSFAGTYAIEPDATAASYYAALPLVTGGALTLLNLHPGLQGDTRFVEVMKRVGLTATKTARGLDVAFTAGSARVGVDEDFNEFSDTFLTLAAISPLLAGPTRITGIAHSRKQETDRVAGMVNELRRLGQDVDEHADGDGLTVTPRPLRTGVEIETYGDHRFAMSFGILGSYDLHGDGRSWLTIKNPACCVKTFPHFFELLESLRLKTLTS
jgi:3-phosphoshikimate 1-carboxyvinyltransferase